MTLLTVLKSPAIRQTLLYGASIALMKGVSLLMLPFIAHQMAPAAFGRLEVVGSLAIIGSVVIGMGLEDALFRFVGATSDPERRRLIAANIFCQTLIVGWLFWIIGWMLAPDIVNWVPGDPSVYEIRLIVSTLALEGAIAVPLGWLRMQHRVTTFFLLTTGRALLQALLVVVMLLADRSVAGVLEAGLIAAVLQALILAVMKLKEIGLHFDVRISYQMVVYSLPIVGSGLVAFALNGLDRWILADHATLDEVACFGVAAKFALAVVLLMQPFGMWWSPQRFKVLNNPNGRQRVAHYVTLGITLTLVLMALAALVAPLIIIEILPETYQQASRYVIGLVLIMGLRELTELINIGCFIDKTTQRQLLINTVGSIIGIVCMLWWVPLFSTWGLIAGLLIAQIARLWLFFWASQQRISLPYPLRHLSIVALMSLAWIGVSVLSDAAAYQILVLMGALISLPIAVLKLDLVPLPHGLRKGLFATSGTSYE